MQHVGGIGEFAAERVDEQARGLRERPARVMHADQLTGHARRNDAVRAQAAIRKASPRYVALTQAQPLKLTEIQAQLDADTLLLEYALGEERSYLWAITRDSLTSYELPKLELIEKNARHVYEFLTARSTNKRGDSASQRHERIAQAEAALPARS